MWTVGAVCALATGLVLPLLTVILGDIVATYDPKNTEMAFEMITALFESVAVMSAFVLLLAYLQYSLLNHAAYDYSTELKFKLLASLLH